MITAVRHCEKCGLDEPVELVRTLASNGASLVYWECQQHHGNIRPAAWIAHKKLLDKNIDIEDLPIVENYENDHECVVCHKKGCELHHFAPRYIFGAEEAEKWPKEYLCRDHHSQWHDLVTPNMSMNRREK